MKSELENLPKRVLYRLLRQYMEFMTLEGLDSYNKSEGKDTIKQMLKKHGIPADAQDLDFMWATFLLNAQEMVDNEEYTFDLQIPKLRSWNVIAKIHGRAWYTEYSAQSVDSYSEPVKRDFVDGTIEFSPWDGNFYDYETHDSEVDDWEIEDIEEIKPRNVTESKRITKENIKPDISNLNLYQLVDLKNQIEKKIANRISIIK